SPFALSLVPIRTKRFRHTEERLARAYRRADVGLELVSANRCRRPQPKGSRIAERQLVGLRSDARKRRAEIRAGKYLPHPRLRKTLELEKGVEFWISRCDIL